jgi:acyl-CoA synthetase (AMP-forming)/AMP-acid ligase II
MIIQSPYDDVVAESSLAGFVLGRAADRGGKPAIIDGSDGRVVSYGELAVLVRRAAAGLAARGVARGDVLALCCPNCPEFPVAFYAGMAAGAVVTTVNPLAPPGEIADAPHAFQGGRRPYMADLQGFATARGASHD